MKVCILLLCFLGSIQALGCEDIVRKIHRYTSIKLGEDFGLTLAIQAKLQIKNMQNQIAEAQRHRDRRNGQKLAEIKLRRFHTAY